MVRAVADPWPGAFSYVGNQNSPSGRRVFILMPAKHSRGAYFCCTTADCLWRWRAGNRHWQAGDGITMQGSQLAQTLGLVKVHA